jgi:hypothetical protein
VIAIENGYTYLAREDGSRIYIDGPWKTKQAWLDDNGLLYEKIPGNGRRYMNGPYANENSFVNAMGKWYYINANGKRVFFN